MLQILRSPPGLISAGLARISGIWALMAVGSGAIVVVLSVPLGISRRLLHGLSLLPRWGRAPGGVGDHLRRLLGLPLHMH